MVSRSKVLGLLTDLRAQRSAASEELSRIDEALEAVERTLALLSLDGFLDGFNEDEASPPAPAEFTSVEFAGKSQLQAIMMLAERNDGTVTIREAKRMLIETRLTESRNCASQVATSSITRSGRFEWVAPGTYRLTHYPRLVRAG